jgi:hypothetical protein
VIVFGLHREYFFEVAAVAINWIALIALGMMLSRLFRRAPKSGELRS